MRLGLRASKRRQTVTAVLAALAMTITTGTLVGSQGPAQADPIDDQIASAQAQLAALNSRVDAAVEDYNAAQLALTDAQRKVEADKAQIVQTQQTLSKQQDELGQIASAAYRSGGTGDVMTLMFSSDTTEFLAKAGTLDRLSRNQAETILAIQSTGHDLAEQQQEADRAVAQQQKITGSLAAQKTSIEKDVATQQTLLAGFQTEKQRLEQIAAQKAAEAAAARAAAEDKASRDAADRAEAAARLAQAAADAAAGADAAAEGADAADAAEGASSASTSPKSSPKSSTSSGSASVAEVSSAPASSDGAATAVEWAKRKLGSPYEWAATGPDRFDCSGLTMYVWAKAGVSLPHSSQAQYDSVPHVSRSQVQPGDLTFYGSPIHHVGIYIGGGKMISAPHTGDVVKVQDAFRSDYVGAVHIR